MEHLVPCPKSVWNAHGMADGPGGHHGCFPVRLLVGILPPYQGCLESLRQVDAMHAPLPCKDIAGEEKGRPVRRLRMELFAQFEQPRLPCQIIEPVYDIQVVRSTPLAPVSPVVKACIRQMGSLITEESSQERQGPGIFRCFVILADNLQDHHLRPPVVSLSPLQAIYEGMVS